ncbi:hypothetical protein [Streptomyces sp. enrichment culture]|uniref:hypothetical protein n=1 Tax=Streptomyces sp. enrichment culture TaxID=1795815 RepID=UPI003F54D6A9
MRIGELSERTGVSRRSIRLADIGWVPVAATVMMGLSFLLAPRPVAEERVGGRSEPQPADA